MKGSFKIGCEVVSLQSNGMKVGFKHIGFVRHESPTVPRHWTVSDVKGDIVIDKKYLEGLRDIKPGQRIVVIFYFHKNPESSSECLIQKPPHKDREMGVFSTCSPIRPNPIGMSILEVLGIDDNIIHVKGIDMLDGTPVLDIKPFVEKDG
ncbi:putative tRNA (adenine(37)-N6)-methyltransferase [bacterium BMS3Bbin06]|nr:putative tRNA (adenine(37)-N6)-methyltransferase [bacterium BMS3Abin08]GBE35276.1 putative tRNA (adenine(37)-N6)-methyltransferase [bacterium BMS3Bbin06]